MGVGAAAVLLGPWASALALSMALVIQALFFGDGGIFDQIFAREAGSSKTTPFHQDAPYTPVTGEDHYFRSWVPLDVVTARTGAREEARHADQCR